MYQVVSFGGRGVGDSSRPDSGFGDEVKDGRGRTVQTDPDKPDGCDEEPLESATRGRGVGETGR